MDHLLQAIVFLLVLSALVVAHEWGHFIVARLFGIRVDDFSIGFGKRLVRLGKRGDTEYNLRMLPLGGFVKIAGMEADEAPLIQAKEKLTGRDNGDPDAREVPLLAENTAESEPYTAPDGFNSKPLWQRSLVILAGPVMSFVTGYAIFCLMGFAVGIPTGDPLNRVGEVEAGGEGQRIDLRAGDTVTAINGLPVTTGTQMIGLIHNGLGRTLTLTVVRDGQTLTKTATPRPLKDDGGKVVPFVGVVAPGALAGPFGLSPGDTLDAVDGHAVTGRQQALTLLRERAGRPATLEFLHAEAPVTKRAAVPASPALGSLTLNEHPIGVLQISPAEQFERVGFAESLRRGNALTGRVFEALGAMVRNGQVHKQVSGIIGIYRATGIAVKNGAPDVLFLAAQLSISLAIFNLFPIPVLDGGHLLNFFIEWVRRGKKMTEQQQQAFMMTGLAIIGVLFVWIMTKNILDEVFHRVPQ